MDSISSGVSGQNLSSTFKCDSKKDALKSMNNRFYSISEKSIDSTDYTDNLPINEKEHGKYFSKNKSQSTGGIKHRLSLKLLKKRDSMISKLEQDQKFLNSSGEPVELEVVLASNETSKSASDLENRNYNNHMNMNFAKNRLSKSSKNNCYNHAEANLLETQPLQTLAHSVTKANQASAPEEIDFDTETEVNNYCDSPLEKKKSNIKFTLNKASFKNDLKKSDHNFEKFLSKNSLNDANIEKSKLNIPSLNNLINKKREMEPIEVFDDEGQVKPSRPINRRPNKKNCHSELLLNTSSLQADPTQLSQSSAEICPCCSQHRNIQSAFSNIEMNHKKSRVAATSIPNSPEAINMVNHHDMLKNFISKSFDNTTVPVSDLLNKNANMNCGYGQNSEPIKLTDDHPINPNLLQPNALNSDLMNDEPKAAAYSYLKYYFVSMLQPSDNKLAMKLFGSKKGVLKEKMRQQEVGHWIIHPCSNFRFYWDLVMLILLIANVIILPIAISFLYENMSHTGLLIFNLVSDSMFLLDIAVNFRTGVLQNDYVDEIILEPKMIAKHYLRTWFFVDFLSSIPLDYLFLLIRESGENFQLARTGRALKVLRLVKLLSLLRLLRLSRLVRYIHQWEEFLSIASMVMRILNLVCLIILLAHWNGCLQFLVPMLQSFPKESWVCLNNLQNADWTEQYTVALFKALSHMLCIGYGRYPPQTYTDMWLTMLSMVTGAMCYAVTIGHVSALVQSFDTSRRMYNDKYKQVEEYMVWRKFPRDMRTRITEYYEHRYQGKMFDEDNILKELSERLRLDIINYNCRSLVSSVPFFANADQNFVSDVVTKLHFEVFQPGDLIIREGTIGNKMYFIQEGIVDIIKTNNEVMTTLSDGSYFGEICLLTKARRVASVQAVTYCNLYSLSVEHFNTVLEQYPMMRRTLESVAAERLNKLGKNPNIISSRQDLKTDRETLKYIVAEASPLQSSRSSSESGLTSRDLKTSRSYNAISAPNDQNIKKNFSLNNFNGKGLDAPADAYTEASPGKKKLDRIKSNIHMHIPNILKKSPSTPSKLSKANDESCSPNSSLNV